MSSFYFIFWFAMSLFAAGLAVAGLIYLACLLKDIKQSLVRIESLLADEQKSTKKKRRKQTDD